MGREGPEMLPYDDGGVGPEEIEERRETDTVESPRLFRDADEVEEEIREEMATIPPTQPPGAVLKTP